MSSEKRILFIFLVGLTWQGKKIRERKEKSKAGADGGHLAPPVRRRSRDSATTASAVEVPSKYDVPNNPTPASQVLSLAWQCDICLHVAYGV
jgi:hypothetical protein